MDHLPCGRRAQLCSWALSYARHVPLPRCVARSLGWACYVLGVVINRLRLAGKEGRGWGGGGLKAHAQTHAKWIVGLAGGKKGGRITFETGRHAQKELLGSHAQSNPSDMWEHTQATHVQRSCSKVDNVM